MPKGDPGPFDARIKMEFSTGVKFWLFIIDGDVFPRKLILKKTLIYTIILYEYTATLKKIRIVT